MSCASNACSTAVVASCGLGSTCAVQSWLAISRVVANMNTRASLALHHSERDMLHLTEWVWSLRHHNRMRCSWLVDEKSPLHSKSPQPDVNERYGRLTSVSAYHVAL